MIQPSGWDELRNSATGHPDVPFGMVNQPVMFLTQQEEVSEVGVAAIRPVGVDMGRGAWISPGPFPHVAPPNRTCGFHRIRLSTSHAVAMVIGLSHGVGILVPR